MKSIKEVFEIEYSIKKSIFIGYLFPIRTEEELDTILKKVKAKWKNANHYCFAYIIGNKKRCSDDGEPNKTAGIPILNILEVNNLDNVGCVVIRYFGGIKLGAGGLIRAYANTAKLAVQNANVMDLEKGYLYRFTSSYEKQKKVEHLLGDTIIEKNYTEEVSILCEVKETKHKEIEDKLKAFCKIEKLEPIWIENHN